MRRQDCALGSGMSTGSARALGNLLARDQMFTERVRQETRRLDLRVIEVDTAMTEDDLAGRVAEAFEL
jgi:transposase